MTKKREVAHAKKFLCPTLQVVHHVGEQLVSAVGLHVERHYLLGQRVAFQTKHLKFEQFAQFVRQNAEEVVVKQQLPEIEKHTICQIYNPRLHLTVGSYKTNSMSLLIELLSHQRGKKSINCYGK
jgi:hypothetical protein